MTKNLKKVIRKIYMNAKEKDLQLRTFNPQDYGVNWEGAIKYLNALDRRITFNKIFKLHYAEIYAADIKTYLATGHKLTYALKKQMKQYAKEKAKTITKAEIEAQATAKQSEQGQEQVQPQG